MKTKAFYTAITTQDIEKTLAFYVGVLDFRVTHNLSGKAGMVIVLENDAGARLDVIEAKDAPAGLSALRTNVDNLDNAIAELQANDCEIIAGPVDITTGRAVLVKDPNGVVIDIVEHKK